MGVKISRLISFSVLFGAFFAFSLQAIAQGGPEMPEPIKNLELEGAQIRFLGRDHGFDSWLAVKNGQEQYFYVLPDGSAFVMGVLFDSSGKLITAQQVSRLQERGDDIVSMMGPERFEQGQPRAGGADAEDLPPSERLFNDIQTSNWVPLGKPGAPVLYSFIEMQCPHCHTFIEQLREKDVFSKGELQLRMIPVGFREESVAQAAFLIATPEPQSRWFRFMDGDSEALPQKDGINDQGVQKNMTIMQSWKFDATPMSVYRDKDGKVKIIRGIPEDLDALINDIGMRG